MADGPLTIETTIPKNLNNFFTKVSPKAKEKGLIALGLQLINNTVNGSPRESSRPPIDTGRLRGSGSVFVGNKKVGDSLFAGKGTPNSSISENNINTVTIGFNTEYAAKMHEHLEPYGIPDPITGKIYKPRKDSGTVTGKFLERHLQADKEDLFDLYTQIYKKNAGT